MIIPDFYLRFSCRAAACKHTCCRGWEIDVDPVSAARYLSFPGPLGDELRNSILSTAEGAAFRLTKEEACPFLRTDGLCRLILAQGEDFLCEICMEHPRFYFELGEALFGGVGLSCEAAVALLPRTGRLTFVDEETGARFTLAALCGSFLPASGVGPPDFSPCPDAVAVLSAFVPCEPIDEAWTRELRTLTAESHALADRAAALYSENRAFLQAVFEYIVFRQLPMAASVGLAAVLSYAARSATFILLHAARFGDLAESVRRWSEEIEYSDVNVELLL